MGEASPDIMAKRKPKRAKPAARKKAASKGGKPEAKPKEEAAPPSEDGDIDFSSLKKIFDDATQLEQSAGAMEYHEVECPHCGELFEVRVHATQDGQQMSEECQVCAKAVSVSIDVVDGEVSVSAYS